MLLNGQIVRPCTSHIRQRGFSLVELMLVLTILLVMTAVALPALARRGQRQALQSAAASVRDRLMAARMTALREGVPLFVWYRDGGHDLRVQVEETTSPRSARSERPATRDSVMDRTLRLPDGIRFASAPTLTANGGTLAASPNRHDSWSGPIRFAPDGTATERTLLVVDTQNSVMRLSVQRQTGTTLLEWARP